MDVVDDQGWIMLYRKSIDSQVFQSEGLWKVWTWCLLKANHKDRWVQVKTGKGTTEVFVKRGQFIFGRKTAAQKLKMRERTVYDRMLKLAHMQNLAIETNTHYSIVTIRNYDMYQATEEDNTTPNPTPNQQPTNTNKNDKNIKNIKCNDFERLNAFLSSLSEYQNFTSEARDLILEFTNKIREANTTKTIQAGRVSDLVSQFWGIQNRTDSESLVIGLKKVFRKLERDGFDFKKRNPTAYVNSVARSYKTQRNMKEVVKTEMEDKETLRNSTKGEVYEGLKNLIK